MKNTRTARVLMTATLVSIGGCSRTEPAAVVQPPARVTTERIRAADAEPGSWLSHGRTYSEQRYSPLAQITRENVGRLGLAWTYELKTTRAASATPLVVEGVMYVTSAWSMVYALDARSGDELWVYDPHVDRLVGAKACCDVVNRGVAFYDGKVFVGVLDGRLVALDAKTGKVLWETVTVDRALPYTITGAPRAAHDLVFIGNGGAEYGVRGYVSAYEANTGRLRWRFYTVPGDPAHGPDNAASDGMLSRVAATWKGEWWKYGGGGTVWDAIVYDPDFDQLIVGVGNGSPWNQQIRSPGGGDNWFLASILALDARTGVYKWHYQTTPAETWDYTATQPIMLADLTIDGAPRKVAMQAPKNGFFYVVDRANGRLVSAAPILPMYPTSATPPGMPLSWAHTIDLATGRPIENPEARYLSGTAVVRPGPTGAHNWQPMSYSADTGLVYLPIQEMALDYTTDKPFVFRAAGSNTGTVHAPLPDDPRVRAAILEATKGFLIAWDPVRQREAWRVTHRAFWNGGTLATAGGLVFQGTVDGRFHAYDAAAGRSLWDYDNAVATLAGPITYTIDGEQYVAVLGGNGSSMVLIAGALMGIDLLPVNGRVHVYKLGGTGTRLPVTLQKAATPKPPAITASPKQIARGADLYGRACFWCHGINAVGTIVTDLRKSARLHEAAAWREVVIDGKLAPLGMPRFGDRLTAGDIEAIRAYVARLAALAYAEEQAAAARKTN